LSDANDSVNRTSAVFDRLEDDNLGWAGKSDQVEKQNKRERGVFLAGLNWMRRVSFDRVDAKRRCEDRFGGASLCRQRLCCCWRNGTFCGGITSTPHKRRFAGETLFAGECQVTRVVPHADQPLPTGRLTRWRSLERGSSSSVCSAFFVVRSASRARPPLSS
jgi:hypothetical protein